MVLEIQCNQDSVKKLEKFLNTSRYKELAENAMSFNRKLNEERKMRIPYVDGQVGNSGFFVIWGRGGIVAAVSANANLLIGEGT